MNKLNTLSLTRFASTIASLSGVEKPKMADEPITWVEDVLREYTKNSFDRVFIQNPDSIGEWIWEKYPDALEKVLKNTLLTIPFRTVLPSVTPVCFGTMYTGALPSVHGIQKYEKPIIKIDSLFDSWLRSGKKVCLISTERASMSNIFKDRKIDIINCDVNGETDEGKAIEKAEDIIIKDEYDVVILYTWMYDTLDHKYGPESKEAINALYRQVDTFDEIVSLIKRVWKSHNTLISFSPDHGCHPCTPTKEDPHLGTHGSDSPLDLNILHFLGAIKERE